MRAAASASMSREGAAAGREKEREAPYPFASAVRFPAMTTPPRDAAKELLPEAVSGSWLRVIAEICGELDVPFRVNGYRYWPAP